MNSPARLAIRGDLLDLVGEPVLDDASPSGGGAVRFLADHWLLVEDGRIVGRQPQDPGEGWRRDDHRGRLVLPGFIDTHVHMPQLEVIASHGADLLDWLARYTFPAERRYAEAAVSRAGAEALADALLAHGTTAAMVFPTVHAVSADAMAEAAAARGMRCITGKVLMDRHAPEGLCDADVATTEAQLRAGIERWHGRDRQAYALTVRFAPCSTPAQLSMAGRLFAEVPGLYHQTHLAENRDEVRWVAGLFPEARSYLDVYHRAGLLGPRAVLAHGIWLDEADRALLADTGAAIAHCPTSNLFLGSGLMDWPALATAGELGEWGVLVALASDVGGGTTLSMVRTMAAAYQVQSLRGQRPGAWPLLHAATRGAARALYLDDEIGTLADGATADVCVWDWSIGALGARRDAAARCLHERVFAWLTLADERHLVKAYVAGVPRFERPANVGGRP
jgi:guanine deaminase